MDIDWNSDEFYKDSEAAALKLWNKVQFRNAIMFIASEITDFFREKIQEEVNEEVRYVSFKDFRSKSVRRNQMYIHYVIMELLSEEGEHEVSIEILQFSQQEDIYSIITEYDRIKQLLESIENMQMAKLLYANEEEAYIVFEGWPLDWANLTELENEEIRMYIMGKIIGLLQETEGFKDKVKLTKRLGDLLLERLPISSKSKKLLRKYLDPRINDVMKDTAYTHLLATINPLEIYYREVSTPISGKPRGKIERDNKFQVFLPFRPKSKRYHHRMEQLGELLTSSFEEYLATKKVIKTAKLAMHLLDGYNQAHVLKEKKGIATLFSVKKMNLDLFIVLATWKRIIEEYERTQRSAPEETIIQYSHHLLSTTPFGKLMNTLMTKWR